MPNVIINTSPMQYLYQINLLSLLPKLYGKIIVPQSVVDELEVGRSLGVALPNINSLNWVSIQQARSQQILPLVTELGAGEREVLALGVEITDSLLVLDDALGRSYANLLGLQLTGTLGIILKGKQQGYLSEVAPILDKLNALQFRLSSSTRDAVLKLAGE
jgi:predicted nucleic acid-binding protein